MVQNLVPALLAKAFLKQSTATLIDRPYELYARPTELHVTDPRKQAPAEDNLSDLRLYHSAFTHRARSERRIEDALRQLALVQLLARRSNRENFGMGGWVAE